MQKDFHYNCVKYLAIASGFEDMQAEIIAYASQYVDDATEHKGIHISKVPPVAAGLIDGGFFQPVCTAHKGIQYLAAVRKDVQRKVYIPFHFIPSRSYTEPGAAYDFRVSPDSALANQVFEKAADRYKAAHSEQEALYGLIQLGIAIHTFADAWSHNRFSGRWNRRENDIERIQINTESGWEPLGLLDQVKYNLIPEIGHAEAVNFPDQSHLSWRYEHDYTGNEITRCNTESFLEAAERIYELLCSITRTTPSWKQHVVKIRPCLALNTDSVKRKHAEWAARFPMITFDYDLEKWRADALSGAHYNWDHYRTAEDFAKLEYEATGDLKWFLFHLAASQQRKFVIANIKKDLL